jgi:hypothetical protein
VACDESASILWARVTRGIDSIPNAVMRASTSACTSSGLLSGHSQPISADPGRSAPISSGCTRPTRTTMSPWR